MTTMLLVDLDPRWWADPGRMGQGFSFLCPCLRCVEDPARQVRLGVAFLNPLDGGAPFPLTAKARLEHVHDQGIYEVPPGTYWSRKGETFETLSLSPSINAEAAGHWHGWVRSGETSP